MKRKKAKQVDDETHGRQQGPKQGTRSKGASKQTAKKTRPKRDKKAVGKRCSQSLFKWIREVRGVGTECEDKGGGTRGNKGGREE